MFELKLLTKVMRYVCAGMASILVGVYAVHFGLGPEVYVPVQVLLILWCMGNSPPAEELGDSDAWAQVSRDVVDRVREEYGTARQQVSQAQLRRTAGAPPPDFTEFLDRFCEGNIPWSEFKPIWQAHRKAT